MKNEKLSFIWDDDEEEVIEKDNSPKSVEQQIPLLHEEIEYYSDEPEEDEKLPKRSINIRLILVIAILVLISVYFIPIFEVEKIKTNETSFITKENLIKNLGVKEGERYSLAKMNKLKNNLDAESVSASKSHYEIKNKTLVIEVNEIKPLAQDKKGQLYYEQEKKIKTTTEMAYDVPLLSDFSEEDTKAIIEELKGLDYNIIKEMAIITSANDKDRSELVYIQMKDGNYIEIGINQIFEKMQYYMQMKKIIREKNNGKPGIIHLNIGDYYEPF